MTYKKKLIEVALPLEAINSESAREKSIRHGHPSTLHLWWARRPLAAARAVIWSSLVDDPSSHPDLFPTEEEQTKERERLFCILRELVKWENSNNKDVLSRAKAEILKSTGGNPPPLLDPFAGGGTIPLEAQRLGLEAHASDLNPVAVMINKAMIEIPPKFAGLPPVNPESRRQMDSATGWEGVAGLAEDFRYYGEWVRAEAFKRVGHLYPQVSVPEQQGGGEATVIAWIWARTVKCPNPACGCTMPLVRSFELSKKKGKEAYIQPAVAAHQITYDVCKGSMAPEGTVNRSGAKCICCGAAATFPYIREEGKQGRIGSELIAIVAEGDRGRLFFPPTEEQRRAAKVVKPSNYPSGALSGKARVNVSLYGFEETGDLFTNRQLTALTTLSDLVMEAQQKAIEDAITAGMECNKVPLSEGGRGTQAYGQAVGVYLAFLVDQAANHSSTICSWNSPNTQMRNTFARQAIPMVWDYAESNIFSNSSGSYNNMFVRMSKAFSGLGLERKAVARQFDAQSDNGHRNIMVSTDPPYYDNIGYADLSDFFYVWMRRSLKDTYPKLFRTMLVPKAEELVATPYRFDGSVERAKTFFEEGMLKAFNQLYLSACDEVPVTVYYAFKQGESEVDEDAGNSIASVGWETMLGAIIQAGFSISGTWPMRTEKPGRSVSIGTNALASSIVIVCRKRPNDSQMITRRDFIAALKRELRPALVNLQRSNIAPVDLAQASIGPGMGVYSRYSQVLESDGTAMSVRSALQLINQELDLYFTEQEGELDRDSRFCVDLYAQAAFNEIDFGTADVLARAKNTSVERMAQQKAVKAEKGRVRLLTRDEIPQEVAARSGFTWMLTQLLTAVMEEDGVDGCAKIMAQLSGTAAEDAKSLAYRLFTIAERKGWAGEAYAYNAFVAAWPDIQSRAAEYEHLHSEQLTVF